MGRGALLFDKTDHLGARIAKTASIWIAPNKQLKEADQVTWDGFSNKVDHHFEGEACPPRSQPRPVALVGILEAFRPISHNTMNPALRRLGYDKTELTTHGLRSTASTLLNESGKRHSDAIERQLAHQEANEIRGAYTHAVKFWQERVLIMRWVGRRA